MCRLALTLLILVAFTLPARSQGNPNPAIGYGAAHGWQSGLGPPGPSDDSTHGHHVGEIWQYDGGIWQATSVQTNAAVWKPIFAQSNFVSPAFTPTPTPRPIDVLGNSAVFACGTIALKTGFVGPAIDVTIVHNAIPTVQTINILGNRLLDTATLMALVRSADAGTLPQITRCYDQTGNGNHAATDGTHKGPLIGLKAIAGNPAMSWGWSAGEIGLAIPDSVRVSMNNFTAYIIGQAYDATGAGASLIEFGQGLKSNSIALMGPPLGQRSQQSSIIFYLPNIREQLALSPQLPLEPQILSIISSASGITFSINEESQTLTALASGEMIGGNLGRMASAPLHAGILDMLGVVIANAPVSRTDDNAIRHGIYVGIDITPQIMPYNLFVVGDSRQQGFMTNAGLNAATQLRTLLQPINPAVRIVNIGYGGQTAADINSHTASLIAAKAVPNTRNIVWIGPIGANDLFLHTPPTAILSSIQRICATFVKAGFIAILSNELVTTDARISGATGPGIPALRELIASGPTGCTATVDPLVMPQLSNPKNLLYYPDGIHIGDLASGVYAHFMASVLAPYLH